MQTAIHAEPWECKHVEHALTRTYLYYYLPDPNFAARLIIGFFLLLFCFSLPRHQVRVVQEESAKPSASTPRTRTLRHEAIIQFTDSISLSVMCKCDPISTSPLFSSPLLSSPLPFTDQDQLGAFFCLCDSCGANFFPPRLKGTRAVKSTLPCHIPWVFVPRMQERECH